MSVPTCTPQAPMAPRGRRAPCGNRTVGVACGPGEITGGPSLKVPPRPGSRCPLWLTDWTLPFKLSQVTPGDKCQTLARSAGSSSAVFAADVEGYSRLMGADEVGTLKG